MIQPTRFLLYFFEPIYAIDSLIFGLKSTAYLQSSIAFLRWVYFLKKGKRNIIFLLHK